MNFGIYAGAQTNYKVQIIAISKQNQPSSKTDIIT